MSPAPRPVQAAHAMLLATYAFWVVFALGIFVSVAITGETTWWRPSVSHFGSVFARSAFAYNALQILDGLLLLALAREAYIATGPLVRSGWMSSAGRTGLAIVLTFEGLLLVSLALFPYDLGGRAVYIYHNVAGWLEALVPAVCITLMPWLFPALPRWFKALSPVVIAVLLGAWLSFVILRVLAHGLTELVVFATVAVWMILFFVVLKRAVVEAVG